MSDDRSKGLLHNKSFWTRTVTGIVMALVLVAIFVIGGDVMFVFLMLLSLIGAFELYRALKIHKSLLSVIGYAAIITHYIFIRFFTADYIVLVYSGALILIMAVFVFRYPRYKLAQLFGAFFGIFYTGVTLSFLYMLRMIPDSGAFLVWLIILSSWGCDIFAYLSGMLFGKHKFAHRISPNKSVEGAVGGVVGATVLALIYGIIVRGFIPDMKLVPLVFALICFFGSVVSQIGDLTASGIKRQVGIKDYGRLFPGHGGVLDRFDSVIIVAPVLYFITVLAVV